MHDVFICHASEDKDDFVRPLAQALSAQNLDVWYDEFTLSIGDSLRDTIDRGLANSQFGIVVLSPHFFQKQWAKRELNGLVAREMAESRQLILPLWHGITHNEVLQHSPPLADIIAVPSSLGIKTVVSELLKKIRPEESPLVIAREFLIEKGLSPPIISDEWWLNIVEIKEADFKYPDLNMDWRWIFPLPFNNENTSKERGLNIAWTALQLDWVYDAKEQNISQLTPPDQVHRFVRKHPGLLDCARNNPSILALYAPQLTIPGYDDGLEDCFNGLLNPDAEEAYAPPFYSSSETTDGQNALCGELVAWRHPTYGNYTNEDLAKSFVSAHNGSYSREVYNTFECLTWLLSNSSEWMPDKLRELLIEGMRTSHYGWANSTLNYDNAFAYAVITLPRSKLKYTRKIKSSAVNLFAEALNELCIDDDPEAIFERFKSLGFVEAYYDNKDKLKKAWKGK